MSRIEQVKCDICGTVKKETNHWFVAWVDLDRVFRITKKGELGTDTDICGQQCAIAALNNYLQTGQILPVKAKELEACKRAIELLKGAKEPESMEAKA